MLLIAFLTMSINQVWGANKTDALTASSFDLSGSYAAKTNVSGNNSNAVYACYAMQSTKNSGYAGGDFQMRKYSGGKTPKAGAYLVSTTSGGKIKNITIEWADLSGSTLSSTSINVYGSNDAFGSDDYYTNIQNGTSLGTIEAGVSTSLNVTGDYTYFGIISTGACYISSFSITWNEGGGSTYTVV